MERSVVVLALALVLVAGATARADSDSSGVDSWSIGHDDGSTGYDADSEGFAIPDLVAVLEYQITDSAGSLDLVDPSDRIRCAAARVPRAGGGSAFCIAE